MKISIIVPVYNASKYISDALGSVLSQNYDDWECICVDDGSTDGSSEILDKFAKIDKRINVIHQKNMGEGAARNTAIRYITGDYFTCLDADDVLLDTALIDCSKALEKGFDAICCTPLMLSFRKVDELDDLTFSFTHIWSVFDKMQLLWGDEGSYGYVSGRVYRTKKFCHLRFPVGMKMCADAWFWIDALMVPAKWCALDRPMIGDRQVANSASNTFDAEFNRCILKAYAHTCESLKGMDYVGDEPMRLFWRRHGRAMCHHMKLLFRDWNTFAQSDKSDLAEMVARIPMQMGWDPFSWHMRWRVFSLRKSYIFCFVYLSAIIAPRTIFYV